MDFALPGPGNAHRPRELSGALCLWAWTGGRARPPGGHGTCLPREAAAFAQARYRSSGMTPREIDLKARRMLLADWFMFLARERGLELPQHSSGGERFTIGNPTSFHVVAQFKEEAPFLEFLASESSRQKLVDDIATEAAEHAERGDLGGVAWHSTSLHEVAFEMSSFSMMGDLLQRLGGQTRIQGWRRLSNHILLEFVEDQPEDWGKKPALLAPKAVVRVHIAAPAPCPGYLSSHISHGVIETVGAICTFALGRPVQLPHSVFPTDEDVSELDERRADPTIGGLARKGTSLDIFERLVGLAGLEALQRARSAFITFDAAVRQERDPVACILYVVAAECLTAPYTSWRLQKLTKRFKEFFDELMPDDLDQIVGHGNFEETFGIRRGLRTARALRRDLLDRIYSYRSGQLHEGLDPSYAGIAVGSDTSNEMRRGLLADFAEAAILRYLEAPRVSLVGHPLVDPPEGGR